MSFFDRSFGSTLSPPKNGLKKGSSTAQLIEKGFAPQNNKIDVLNEEMKESIGLIRRVNLLIMQKN